MSSGSDTVLRTLLRCSFTLEFVLRELTGPEGGFLSAIDAETDGHEGAYYTWTAAELDAALTGDEGRLFRVVYGLEGPPTFEGDRYVLYLHTPLAEQARAGGLSVADLQRRLAPGGKALLEARSRREQPLTDDKVLADWNGLAIGAMARAGARLAEPRYLEAAERAAGFVLSRPRPDFPGKENDWPKGGEPPDRKSARAAEHPGHEAAPRADVQEAQEDAAGRPYHLCMHKFRRYHTSSGAQSATTVNCSLTICTRS